MTGVVPAACPAEISASAGIVQYDRGRGAGLADLNLDGLPDLVVVNVDGPSRVWRNVGAGTADAPARRGHWLGVRLSQPGGNVDAIGARIDVQTGDLVQRRELVVGGGHASGELGWTSVGLGPATSAQVRITWPDGVVGPWMPVPADGFVRIARDAGQATPWVPGS